jgi:hypothetical protein
MLENGGCADIEVDPNLVTRSITLETNKQIHSPEASSPISSKSQPLIINNLFQNRRVDFDAVEYDRSPFPVTGSSQLSAMSLLPESIYHKQDTKDTKHNNSKEEESQPSL